ncbi:peptidoglycan-associated lipoprotein Pal, partial [bacterium]|nr:peptidoglycan-associated lipoprotein Pal [bacterium]
PEVALVLSTVFFEYDKAELTSEARGRLAENARQLQANPEVRILIEGHCDERGTVEYNLALGERRAQATRNYLINFGIRPDRIKVVSYGKERPVDHGHNAQAWAKNRRAEFVRTN